MNKRYSIIFSILFCCVGQALESSAQNCLQARTLPYAENFDNVGPTDTLSVCMKQKYIYSALPGYDYWVTDHQGAHSGTNCLVTKSSILIEPKAFSAIFYTPLIHFEAAKRYKIQCYARSTSLDGSTRILAHLYFGSGQFTLTRNTYQLLTALYSVGKTGDYRIEFNGDVADPGSKIYIDDIVIEEFSIQ